MRLFMTLVIVTTCVVMTLHAATEDKTARWADTPGAYFDILTQDGSKPLVRYMYARDTSDEKINFETAKVFHHVFDAAGKETITKGADGLFPHHRGLFIGWNKIAHNGKTWDLWHVKNTEQIHKAFVEKFADDNLTRIASIVHWRTADGTVLIEEKRTITVYFTDDDAHAMIDFVSELKAVNGDLKLDGDPEHAGMQYRPSQKVADNKSSTYIFPTKDTDVTTARDLPWATLTYNIGDDVYSVQHMNHPDNPKGTIYSAYRDYGRFGAFPVVDIKDGQTQTLQYRIRITPGDAPDREAMAAEYKKFAGQ